MVNDTLEPSRTPTPAHHPTAGVYMHRHEIESIVSFGFPNYRLDSVKEIPAGMSYNNRIYFLELERRHDYAAKDPQRVVLKVCGRFFGANKVENEVACLQLVQRYCPNVPAPRPLAWSGDGHLGTFLTNGLLKSYSLDIPLGAGGEPEHGGWIIMSHVPGNRMAAAELDDEKLTDLGRQLGTIVANLRLNIPAQTCCGNIRLPDQEQRGSAMDIDGTNLVIKDIIYDGIRADGPITNSAEYYRVKLMDKMKTLAESETYVPNRSLLGSLRDFMATHLDASMASNEPSMLIDEFVFTHYDLSPRNILISDDPPRITGLVDFEFSGFFPAADEFLNDKLNNSNEWPRGFYEAYLSQLQAGGVATPARGFDEQMWQRNCWLETLIGNVAPWDLPGGLEGEELSERLKEAKNTVLEMVNKLEKAGS